MNKILVFLVLISFPAWSFSQDTIGNEEAATIIENADALFDDTDTTEAKIPPNILSGYLESSLLTLQEGTNQDWALQNANKLKLKIDVKSDTVKVHAEVNFNYYTGFNSFNLLDYVPQDLQLPIMPFYSNFALTYPNGIQVGQAYAAINLGPLQLTLGRQPLTLGTGYVWNPVDGINSKNMFDPSYELASQDAFMLSSALPLNGELRVAGIMAERWTNVSLLAVARIHLGYDWELSYQSLEKTDLDMSTFSTTNYRQQIAGLATSGEIWKIGVHGELAFCWDGRLPDHFKALAGLDYTFKVGNQIMLEYLWDDSGREHPGDYTLTDWLWYLSGVNKVMGQHYLFFSSTQTLWDITQLTLAVLYNASDGSLFYLPQFQLTLSDILEIQLRGGVGAGYADTEFGDVPVSMEVRFNAYF